MNLQKPYAMVGVPLKAAETDVEAQKLATSEFLHGLKLIRGELILVPPLVESMDGLWSDAQRVFVESRMKLAVIGGPDTVRQRLAQLADQYGDCAYDRLNP
jgi:alkanesulfonate monooxygenase SsuD/methylene tetrahydromethanopterin reductase-like flavin-dependent oxidoreductase (luciferase family)